MLRENRTAPIFARAGLRVSGAVRRACHALIASEMASPQDVTLEIRIIPGCDTSDELPVVDGRMRAMAERSSSLPAPARLHPTGQCAGVANGSTVGATFHSARVSCRPSAAKIIFTAGTMSLAFNIGSCRSFSEDNGWHSPVWRCGRAPVALNVSPR